MHRDQSIPAPGCHRVRHGANTLPRMRARALAAAAALLLAGPTLLAFFSGGFFDRPRLLAGLIAWTLMLIAALLAPQPLPRSAAGRTAAAGLLLLCAWSALSLAWAPLDGRAQDEVQRLLLYLGAFLAAAALLRSPAARRLVEPALAGGTVLVVSYALGDRLLPSLVEYERGQTSGGRIEQPLTYWNAMGALAALGLVLALRLAGDSRRGTASRAAAAAACAPLAACLHLTFSRGAYAALATGVLVLVALAPQLREQLRGLAAAAVGALPAALLAALLPAVHGSDPDAAGRTAQGLALLAGLAACAGAAALVSLRLARRPAGGRPAWAPPRRVLVGAAVALALGGVLATAALEGSPEARTPAQGASAARLASLDTNRYAYWEVAGEVFAESPLQGAGAGSFAVEWLIRRDEPDPARDAHSLYLETAAELGLVGLTLLAVFLTGVALALRRLHRQSAALAAGPAAALVAWALHAAVDWDWEMPGLTLVALVLAGAAVGWSESARSPAGGAGGRVW